jgi:hypothetical protein
VQLAVASASAAEPEPLPPASTWYGWQTLAIDAASLVLGGAIAATADVAIEPLNIVAATWFGAGATFTPAVHYAHDNWPVGLSAFGLRVVAPPVIGLVGWLGACTGHGEFDSECAQDGWGVGSLVGLSGAALVDGLLLARERPQRTPPGRPTHWYGWQLLVLDVLGYGGGAVLAARNPRTDDGDEIHPALPTWAVGYTVTVIGAPIVHFAHARVGIGFASLGLRLLAAPLIGVLPGLWGYCAATGGGDDDCAAHGAQWGLLGGSLAVGLFDALVLAHEPADPGVAATPSPALTLGPGTIGVSGVW